MKEKDDIIRRLTQEDKAAMTQMIELESKIQLLEKKNEKKASETINTYQSAVKKNETGAKEEMKGK